MVIILVDRRISPMGNIFQELYYCRRENGDSRNVGARLWLGGWPIASSILPQKTAISFPLYRKSLIWILLQERVA